MMYDFCNIIGGYLLGSIPFGLLLTRWAGLGDIRQQGSGNIGATNVLRSGRKTLALLTLLLDASKGYCVVYVSQTCAQSGHFNSVFSPSLAIAAAAFTAVCGHIFPVWLRGKGGKGVATVFGVLVAITPDLAALCLGIWLVTFAISRYSSLSALVAVIALPGMAWFLHQEIVWCGLWSAVAMMILWTHRANIKRLIQGHESRFGQRHAVSGVEKSPPPTSRRKR